MKGQTSYGCLTLHNVIWKTIKRKINLQIKIRQIVKLNDKCNKKKVINPLFRIFEIQKMIAKHLRLGFFQMSGCVKGCSGYTVAIISFHTMHMRTLKSLVSFVLIQGLHGL